VDIRRDLAVKKKNRITEGTRGTASQDVKLHKRGRGRRGVNEAYRGLGGANTGMSPKGTTEKGGKEATERHYNVQVYKQKKRGGGTSHRWRVERVYGRGPIDAGRACNTRVRTRTDSKGNLARENAKLVVRPRGDRKTENEPAKHTKDSGRNGLRRHMHSEANVQNCYGRGRLTKRRCEK